MLTNALNNTGKCFLSVRWTWEVCLDVVSDHGVLAPADVLTDVRHPFVNAAGHVVTAICKHTMLVSPCSWIYYRPVTIGNIHLIQYLTTITFVVEFGEEFSWKRDRLREVALIIRAVLRGRSCRKRWKGE